MIQAIRIAHMVVRACAGHAEASERIPIQNCRGLRLREFRWPWVGFVHSVDVLGSGVYDACACDSLSQDLFLSVCISICFSGLFTRTPASSPKVSVSKDTDIGTERRQLRRPRAAQNFRIWGTGIFAKTASTA